MAQQNETQVWVVVNWCESPESEPGCFGKFFATYDEAWKFAKKDARSFKKQNGIDGKLDLDEDDGHIYLEWGDVMHHWLVEQLNKG